jgi:outer membrane biogenesis lipoprotein LolB
MKKFLVLLSISLLLNSCSIKTNNPNTEGLSNLEEIINSGAELSEEILDE